MLRILIIVAVIITLLSCKQENKAVTNEVIVKKPQKDIPIAITADFINELAAEEPDLFSYKEELTTAYIENGEKPFWYEQKQQKQHVELFFSTIDTAVIEGFDTEPYDISSLKTIAALPDSTLTAEQLFRQDVLLTNLLLHLAQFKKNGALKSGPVPDYWNIFRNEKSIEGILKKVLNTDPAAHPFAALEIDNKQYKALKKHLFWLKQKEQEGGWNKVDSIGKIEVGATSEAVPSLRKRLEATGELASIDLESVVFDSTLYNAVKIFQKKHGLNEDGVPGGKTLLALNKTVWEKIEQVKVNMERWKWLPEQLEEEYVLVNIPGFTAYAFRDQQKEMEMRVITGTANTVTPVFKDTIEYIVASPYWNIPFSISTGEILPQLKKNPSYIDNKHMEVLAAGNVVDHHSIDWSNVSRATFRYQIRQKPGAFNSLGRIKFMFPNKYSVYMHDTNAKDLFNRDERTFSHGCIRVSKPVDFARYLLHDQEEWTIDSLDTAMSQQKEQIIRISKKVPVYILYFTAWADDEGNVKMYKDVYWRDQPINSLNNKISI